MSEIDKLRIGIIFIVCLQFYWNGVGEGLPSTALHGATAETSAYKGPTYRASSSYPAEGSHWPVQKTQAAERCDFLITQRCNSLLHRLICWLTEREDYHYSGSDNEEEEHQIAGEPSSIIPAQSGDTLRRNFQQIQVHFV